MKHEFLQHRFHVHKYLPDELHRLYYGNAITTFGFGLISIFIPLYLLELGYGLEGVILYFIAHRALGLVGYPISGYLSSRFGPKHALMYHYFFKCALLVNMLLLAEIGSLIYILPFTHQFSASGNPIDIELSKISSAKNSGRSLGSFYVYDRLASSIAPLIGGLLASIFGFRLNITVSLLLVTIAGMIIASGPELVKLKKLSYSDFNFKDYRTAAAGHFGTTLDFMVRANVWPLFLGIFVFAGASNYAGVGVIAAVSLIIAVFLSSLFGKLSDKGYSKSLMTWSTVALSLSHISRVFVSSSITASISNLPSSSATSGNRIPFYKGVYALANKHPQHRVEYLVLMNVFYELTIMIGWTLLFILVNNMDDKMAFQVFFIITGLVTLSFLGSRKMFNK